MRILFDTSVLVAAFVQSHPKHHGALAWLQKAKAKPNVLFVSGHSLAECFAVLTRLPLSPRITPNIAQKLLQDNLEKSAKISVLTPRDYQLIIKEMTGLGLSGEVIYDAITLKAAKKAKVDKVLTFNLRDFHRLLPENPSFIISP